MEKETNYNKFCFLNEIPSFYLRVIVRENRAGAKDGGPPISTKFSAIKDYPIG